MTINQSDWEMAFDASREFIRNTYEKEGCVVGIGEVLQHLDEVFGEAAGLTSDVGTVLSLCFELWADPHVRQVAEGGIEFFWTDAGDWPREGFQSLRDRLLGRSDPEQRL